MAAPLASRPPGLAPPQDLTLPEPGSTTTRLILAAALRRLIGELVHAHDVPFGEVRHHGEVRALRALVAGLAREEPGLLAHLARLPSVGALVRCLRGAAREGGGPRAARLQTELSATLALELAFAGRLSRPLVLTRFPPRIVALHARCVLTVPQTARRLVFEPLRVRIVTAAGERCLEPSDPELLRPHHPIDARWVLAEADNNPLAAVEAHPDKAGNAIDLGGRRPEAWVAAISDALDLVAAHLPELREEMRLVVQQLVPVGFDAERHLSASYQEAIGTVYMTLHPSLMTMAEALIHEFSHNKLALLFEIDPVLENAFHPLFTSPVRPDPRPLHGILLAVHAFVPVARLYERMTEAGHPQSHRPDFQARFRQIVAGNREGTGVLLENARASGVGQGLLDELARWDAHFARV
jgi:HEXXH motif-containing protein